MGKMKQLYTELQEAGWEKKDIEKIPDDLAWKMVGKETLKEQAKRIKAEMAYNEDEYMEQEEIDRQEEIIRNEPSSEGYN